MHRQNKVMKMIFHSYNEQECQASHCFDTASARPVRADLLRLVDGKFILFFQAVGFVCSRPTVRRIERDETHGLIHQAA